jgi:hypothetical protein
LGKRRYREIARCGPRDDCGEHPGWGKRERRQQANVSFHLALVLRDLGERLNATRYEIVDPSPCFDDRQQERRRLALVRAAAYSSRKSWRKPI